MADTQIWLKAATLRALIVAEIEAMYIPREHGVAATYVAARRRALLLAADRLPRTGLARVRHLQQWLRAAESERFPLKLLTQQGLIPTFRYAPGWVSLTTGPKVQFRHPEAFLKRATAERAMQAVREASFEYQRTFWYTL